MFTDLTRGRPSNESSHKSEFTMEDPADFNHQKRSVSSRKEFDNILVLPLLVNYINNYDICNAASLHIFMTMLAILLVPMKWLGRIICLVYYLWFIMCHFTTKYSDHLTWNPIYYVLCILLHATLFLAFLGSCLPYYVLVPQKICDINLVFKKLIKTRTSTCTIITAKPARPCLVKKRIITLC